MEDWTELDGLKQEYGERLSLVHLDVGSQESVNEAAKAVGERVTCLDMLVDCAGIFQTAAVRQ